MVALEISERQRPIDEYLNRSKSEFNELQNLQSRGTTYYLTQLRTDLHLGLSSQAVKISQQQYGRNQLTKKKLKSFCELFLKSLEDLMLRILIGAAIISIIIDGIFSEDKDTFWIEGASILAAVAVCSIVASVNDYQKQKQFQDLNEIAQRSNKYELLRDGVGKDSFKDEIVVGDIIKIKSGMEIPVDGIIVEAKDIIVDESAMTGENQQLHKNVLDHCLIHGFKAKDAPSPVIISGSKIMSGQGFMVCLLVGKENRVGKLNELLQGEEDEKTPLEQKLDELAEKIGIFGLVSAALVFVILVIKLFIIEIIPKGWDSSIHIGQILSYLILAVVIVVVAVPEGLPLAVTLSLAFSVKKMLQQKNLVRRLVCCETMGSAHVICTDKTGTLTQNNMSVVEVWNGQAYRNEEKFTAAFSSHILGNAYQKLIFECIAHNSTAVLEPEIKGPPTEVALLAYANQIKSQTNLLKERKKYDKKYFLRLPFNSDRKRITTGVTINNRNFIFLTGASEIVLEACQGVFDTRIKNNLGIGPINKNQIDAKLTEMTSRGLRTVALAIKEVPQIPNLNNTSDKDKFGVRDVEKSGFNLLLLVAIQDLPRPQSKSAIGQCNKAGVVVIMVTGDNSATARAIADQLGITRADDKRNGLCMQGDQFQRLVKDATPLEFFERVKNLKVLSRSRPQHKYKLVEGLKSLNNVVAVTGDGTNDAPALKKANVGIAMGISGTQVAKNAADILILDDNFTSIVRSIVWGRNIYDSVKKFLQFQLTANAVACIFSIISSAVFSQSVFTTVQMLWVNMIMDSLASLALATEAPDTQQLLKRKPVNRNDSLITKTMIKHIIIQSLFQIAVLSILVLKGQEYLPEFKDQYDSIIGTDLQAKYYLGEPEGTMTSGLFYPLSGDYSYEPYFKKYHVYSRHFTFIFNVFVLMQAFNFIPCRKINDQLNLFKGLCGNYIFFIMLFLIVGFQVVIITYLNVFFNCYNYSGLTIQQWVLSILISFLVIPLSLIIRLIPIGREEIIDHDANENANDLQFREQQDEFSSDLKGKQKE